MARAIFPVLEPTTISLQQATLVIVEYKRGKFKDGALTSDGHTIEFSQSVSTNLKPQSVSSQLELTDVVPQPARYEEVSDTLELSQSYFLTQPISVSASNTLALVDSARNSAHGRSVSQTIDFTQSTVRTGAPISRSVSSNISQPQPGEIPPELLPDPLSDTYAEELEALLANYGLRQSVSYRYSIKAVSVTSNLSLGQGLTHGTEISILEFLNLGQSVTLEDTTPIVHDLMFFQSVTVESSFKTASHTITFTQAVDPDLVRNRSVTSTLALGSWVSGFYSSYGDNAVDAPLGTPGQGATDARSHAVNPVTLTPGSGVVFTYPYSGPTLTLNVKNPNFGDTETLNFRRVARNLRGGKFELYRRSIWPKWHRKQLTFVGLAEAKRTEVFQFLNESVGKEVGYLDYEGRQWRGVITTPAAQFREVGKLCQHEVTVEFEGELV